VILYECLTGKVPFEASTHNALILAIAKNDPKPPSMFREDLPKDLEEVILTALGPNRYASVEELMEALLPFAASEAGRMTAPPGEGAKRSKSSQWIAAAIAVGALGAALAGWSSSRSPQVGSGAESSTEPLTDASLTQTPARGPRRQLPDRALRTTLRPARLLRSPEPRMQQTAPAKRAPRRPPNRRKPSRRPPPRLRRARAGSRRPSEIQRPDVARPEDSHRLPRTTLWRRARPSPQETARPQGDPAASLPKISEGSAQDGLTKRGQHVLSGGSFLPSDNSNESFEPSSSSTSRRLPTR
jgi:hypothetical protein